MAGMGGSIPATIDVIANRKYLQLAMYGVRCAYPYMDALNTDKNLDRFCSSPDVQHSASHLSAFLRTKSLCRVSGVIDETQDCRQ